MKIINLPNQHFSVSQLQTHYKNDINEDNYKFNHTLNYIQSYYYEINEGHFYKYNTLKDNFKFINKQDFKSEVLDKLNNNKQILKIIKQNNKIFNVVSKIDKPRLYEDDGLYYINLCKGFLHQNYKEYDEYSADIRNRVNLMLNYIKEISCNNNEELFRTYLKYYGQLARGQKTEVIIYKKSEEGTGKSTETNFIMNYVLGPDVCIISNPDPLTTSNNKIWAGKLLIVFEELPVFSESQWAGVSSKLKTLTTENECIFTDKYEKSFTAENNFNFMINTNVNALKDSNGRRIVIMPINNSRIGDYDYFSNIRDKCFNKAVGEAFYSYLMTKIDVKNFIAQRDIPDGELKKIARANLLNSVAKFIKYQYLLQNRSITKVSTTELYFEYCNYCDSENITKKINKLDFYKKLEDEYKFERKKLTGYYYYFKSLEELKEIANRHKWLCEYDEEDKEQSEEEKPEFIDYEKLYKELLLKYNNLEEEMKVLKQAKPVIIEQKQEIIKEEPKKDNLDDIFSCPCGSSYTKKGKAKHLLTKKHKEYEEQQNKKSLLTVEF